MNQANDISTVREGDVIEFTLRGERRTAEVMILSEDDQVLLDLFDGDRPAFGRLSLLADVAVFRPEAADSSRPDRASTRRSAPARSTCRGTGCRRRQRGRQ